MEVGKTLYQIGKRGKMEVGWAGEIKRNNQICRDRANLKKSRIISILAEIEILSTLSKSLELQEKADSTRCDNVHVQRPRGVKASTRSVGA
jgi:hypothetical protein